MLTSFKRLTESPQVRQAFGVWAATRLLLVIFTLVTGIFEYVRGHHEVLTTSHGLLGLWYRWDATSYLHIVQGGYADLQQAAFFPLFPALVSGISHLIGGHALVVAMVITNLATLVAFVGVAALAQGEGMSQRATLHAVLAFAFFPMAYYLGAAYAEAMFIAAAVWCLWAMRHGRWYTAALCMLLAALLRPTGLILFAPLVFEFLRQHDWGRAIRLPAVPQGLAAFSAGPAGIGIYSFYCAGHYGDPLAWLHSQALTWNRPVVPLWESFYDAIRYLLSFKFLSAAQDKKLVDWVAMLFVVVVTGIMIKRQPVSFTLYIAGMLYLAVSAPYVVSASQHYAAYLSASRYMLPAIPVYLAIGIWSERWRWLERAYLAGSLLLQAVFAVYFLHGGWVA